MPNELCSLIALRTGLDCVLKFLPIYYCSDFMAAKTFICDLIFPLHSFHSIKHAHKLPQNRRTLLSHRGALGNCVVWNIFFFKAHTYLSLCATPLFFLQCNTQIHTGIEINIVKKKILLCCYFHNIKYLVGVVSLAMQITGFFKFGFDGWMYFFYK